MHLPPFFNMRCESSARDFCVLLLRICKVKCDWSIRPDVTELVSRLEFADRIFRRRQARAGNRSAFAGYCFKSQARSYSCYNSQSLIDFVTNRVNMLFPGKLFDAHNPSVIKLCHFSLYVLYEGLCITMYGYIGLCMLMYGDIGLCSYFSY